MRWDAAREHFYVENLFVPLGGPGFGILEDMVDDINPALP